jgi:hypothetical protein
VEASQCDTLSSMDKTPEYLTLLAQVVAARRKVDQAEKRLKAATEARDALVRKAAAAGIRPVLVQEAATLPRATYYRIVGPQRGKE